MNEGKLAELPEIPREETEAETRDQGKLELYPEPTLDITMITEDPEVIAKREGVHNRIQAEIQHKDKEAEVEEEEMLEIPPEWNAVPDLIMENEEELMITKMDNKPKRDKVVRGLRKQQKEDDIRPEKHEHSPTVSRRTRNPEGFYSEDWDEF